MARLKTKVKDGVLSGDGGGGGGQVLIYIEHVL